VRWSQQSQYGRPQSLKREIWMCEVLKLTWQSRAALLVIPGKSSPPLLHTASASCSPLTASFTTYPGTGIFGKQICPLPATQLLRRSWYRELLHFLAQEMTQGSPSKSPQDLGKGNSFQQKVQSCPPEPVAAACVTSASLLTWSPWCHEALTGFPTS